MRRITGRDQAALAELYDRTAGLLYSNAIHMLSDPREAEEVVQDVFIQVWNKAAMFDRELGNPLSWILGIARNRCIDRLRSRQRRSRVFDDGVDQTEVESGSEAPVRPEALISEDAEVVRGALKELPADQREAITLAFFGGMTQQEISNQLKVPLGTVKARVRRGMLKLHERLQALV